MMNSARPYIMFRCDASSTIGLGHLMRCLAIADELSSTHNLPSGFALREDPLGAELVRGYNYPVFLAESCQEADYRDWLQQLAQDTDTRALVLDIRDRLPDEALEDLRRQGLLLVTIDDPSSRRLLCDLAFYPPVPQVERMSWSGFKGKRYVGWDWIPLRKRITEMLPGRKEHQSPSLLITTGGADPARMAPRIVEVLDTIDRPFEATVMVGPAFSRHEELASAIASSVNEFRIERRSEVLPDLMAQADLAITSFGVTAFELAALGVPALYLNLTQDHQESASAFEAVGLGISLGLFSTVCVDRFRQELSIYLDNPRLREETCRIGRETVDGKGASRIAQLIFERLRESARDA